MAAGAASADCSTELNTLFQYSPFLGAAGSQEDTATQTQFSRDRVARKTWLSIYLGSRQALYVVSKRLVSPSKP